MLGQVLSVSHSYKFNVKCADCRYDLVPVYVDTVLFFSLLFYKHIYILFFVSFSLRHMGYELFLKSLFLHVAAQALAHLMVFLYWQSFVQKSFVSYYLFCTDTLLTKQYSLLKCYKIDLSSQYYFFLTNWSAYPHFSFFSFFFFFLP